MSVDFLTAFREFLGRNGWPSDSSPWSIVEKWEQFVVSSAGCYRWGLYEFENELRVRDLLQQWFEDERVSLFSQTGEIRRRVLVADTRFRALLIREAAGDPETPWWKGAILGRAGTEYCADVKRVYGLTINPC